MVYSRHGSSAFGFCGLIRGEVGIADIDYEVQILAFLCAHEASCWPLFVVHLPSTHSFHSLKNDNGLKFCLHKVVVKDTKIFFKKFINLVYLESFGICSLFFLPKH